MADNSLSIGQVAKATNLSVDTIRFYEQKELIYRPPRTPSGYRQYTPDVIRRISYIKRAKNCGFTLEDIKELLTLRNSSSAKCADVKRRVNEKISEIKSKIDDLERFREALGELDAICKGKGPISECPILDALDAVEVKVRG